MIVSLEKVRREVHVLVQVGNVFRVHYISGTEIFSWIRILFCLHTKHVVHVSHFANVFKVICKPIVKLFV